MIRACLVQQIRTYGCTCLWGILGGSGFLRLGQLELSKGFRYMYVRTHGLIDCCTHVQELYGLNRSNKKVYARTFIMPLVVLRLRVNSQIRTKVQFHPFATAFHGSS